MSVWNLHERTLEEATSRIVVDGEWPLRFMDMTGFDPDHSYRLSPTSSRLPLTRLPLLRTLTERYARELRDAGWRDVGSGVAIGGRLANGIVFDETMAFLHATGIAGQDFGDLASAQGTEAFMSWLREPVVPWTSDRISRYALQRVINERADVIAAFPDMYGLDNAEFASWWRTSGREEMDVPVELLAPAAASDNAAAATRQPSRPTLERPVRTSLVAGPRPRTTARWGCASPAISATSSGWGQPRAVTQRPWRPLASR